MRKFIFHDIPFVFANLLAGNNKRITKIKALIANGQIKEALQKSQVLFRGTAEHIDVIILSNRQQENETNRNTGKVHDREYATENRKIAAYLLEIITSTKIVPFFFRFMQLLWVLTLITGTYLLVNMIKSTPLDTYVVYRDADEDGFGSPNDSLVLTVPNGLTQGYVRNKCDLDDYNEESNWYYPDKDGDGEGEKGSAIKSLCKKSSGYSKNNLDPNDRDKNITSESKTEPYYFYLREGQFTSSRDGIMRFGALHVNPKKGLEISRNQVNGDRCDATFKGEDFKECKVTTETHTVEVTEILWKTRQAKFVITPLYWEEEVKKHTFQLGTSDDKYKLVVSENDFLIDVTRISQNVAEREASITLNGKTRSISPGVEIPLEKGVILLIKEINVQEQFVHFSSITLPIEPKKSAAKQNK